MLIVNNKWKFNWIKSLSNYRSIKWLNKFNNIFLLNSIILLIILMFIYFMKWFINNIDIICMEYIEKNAYN